MNYPVVHYGQIPTQQSVPLLYSLEQYIPPCQAVRINLKVPLSTPVINADGSHEIFKISVPTFAGSPHEHFVLGGSIYNMRTSPANGPQTSKVALNSQRCRMPCTGSRDETSTDNIKNFPKSLCENLPKPRSCSRFGYDLRPRHSAKCLVKTGSSITINNTKIANKLNLPLDLKPRGITPADGSIETTRFPLSLLSLSPTIKLNVKAAVLPTTTAGVLLGMEFLHFSKLIILFLIYKLIL
ncbi:hypothetical protein ROZALSC1DRAFT_22644 [Rozella allomycis CSF55]|uniref:Uncharacterized protein n=1 Tax=Rozella allomycis (strain CSF55) TaxID=988480 RepID=A0A4P9YJ05_ROZAC|nr:hypothetical protein ROZALSC1DRAFT_22644 [Rozella allomycis CSF55]